MDPRFEVIPPPPPPPVPGSTYSAPKKSVRQGIGGAIAAVVLFAAKFKFLLLGGLKTGLSMLLMIWIYAQIFGWPYAAALVFLIFVHEMGHVVAAKWLGLPVSAPLFIPFFGAAITMKENPRDAWTEAMMAYGGPLAGCIGSWVAYVGALQMGVTWLMAAASTSFVLNLFNMIPVPPLDGGRICAAVSPWFWLIGIVLLVGAVFYFHALGAIFIVILVLFVAFPRLKQTLFGAPDPALQAYYNTHISNRIFVGLLYLALIAVLLIGYSACVDQLGTYPGLGANDGS
jgi:Zn-dependent protease